MVEEAPTERLFASPQHPYTAALLKALLPKTKLVLFSAFAEPAGNLWATRAGIDLVVPKGSLIDMARSLKSLAAHS